MYALRKILTPFNIYQIVQKFIGVQRALKYIFYSRHNGLAFLKNALVLCRLTDTGTDNYMGLKERFVVFSTL
jgi:hypothetical protein